MSALDSPAGCARESNGLRPLETGERWIPFERIVRRKVNALRKIGHSKLRVAGSNDLKESPAVRDMPVAFRGIVRLEDADCAGHAAPKRILSVPARLAARRKSDFARVRNRLVARASICSVSRDLLRE